MVGRQHSDQQSRDRHQKNAERKHALASIPVAEMRHDDASERSSKIAHRKDAERLQLTQPVGEVIGKKQLADHARKKTKMTKS